jgi:RsiW-degrading membrane proteinase PrsW (M82 family)
MYELYIALLPVVYLLSYVYRHDYEKEPRGLLIKLFIFGALSTVPILFIELAAGDIFPTTGVSSFVYMFLTIFITVALAEEFFKWIITYVITFRNKEYNHPYDGIVYAVFTSLGFACAENLLYVFTHGVDTGWYRAITAVPSHCVDAVLMGYFFSKSKAYANKNDNRATLYLILSIMVPSLLHTFYDSIIFLYSNVNNPVYLVIFYAQLVVSYFIALTLVKKIAKVKYNFDGSELTVNNNKR